MFRGPPVVLPYGLTFSDVDGSSALRWFMKIERYELHVSLRARARVCVSLCVSVWVCPCISLIVNAVI